MFLFVSIYLCERKLIGVEKWFSFPSPSFIECAVSKTQLYPSALPSSHTGMDENKVIFYVVVMKCKHNDNLTC